MADAALPPDQDPGAIEMEQPQAVCRRCGLAGPVGDDGFCDQCEKALEQACL